MCTMYSGCCIESRLLGMGRKEAIAVTVVSDDGSLAWGDGGAGGESGQT